MHNTIMDTTIAKSSASIRINSGILKQLKEEAKKEDRSLSNYLETLLYEMGYRPYNEETVRACREAREGEIAGVVDTTSLETIEASLFGSDDEAEED